MSDNVTPLRRHGLKLRSGLGEKKGEQTYDWVGAWPPPERLVVIIDVAAHQSKVLDPAVQHPDTIPSFVGRPGFDVLEFVLMKVVTETVNPRQKLWAEYVVRRGVRGAPSPERIKP